MVFKVNSVVGEMTKETTSAEYRFIPRRRGSGAVGHWLPGLVDGAMKTGALQTQENARRPRS